MKLNKTQRKQVAEALKAAKPYLDTGRGGWKFNMVPYICFALSRPLKPGPGVGLAKCIIMERLFPCTTVPSWLYDQGYKKNLTRRNIQLYRHRWLDALIEEFSK